MSALLCPSCGELGEPCACERMRKSKLEAAKGGRAMVPETPSPEEVALAQRLMRWEVEATERGDEQLWGTRHMRAISRYARSLEAEVGHLRAALEHIRHVCRIGASPEWACRAARGEAEAALGERGGREERGRLSDKAREARRPLPPENLVGALQDTVHEDTGRTRAVHVGTREEPSDA